VKFQQTSLAELLAICGRLKELTVVDSGDISCEILLTEWAKVGFKPQAFVGIKGLGSFPGLIKQWLQLNPSSPSDHTCLFKLYECAKIPMDLFPLLPDFQLQFDQSCTLPFVQASNYGLKKRFLLLNDCVSGSKVQHKAAMLKIKGAGQDILNHLNDYDSLSFVTHLNISGCRLYSGHLEQVAMACPNLTELNLTDNPNCLKNLHGLHVIATYCQNLQGLN